MESDLEAQLCFEFDNLKSFVVDWCVRMVLTMQRSKAFCGCPQTQHPWNDQQSTLLQQQQLDDEFEKKMYDLPPGVPINEETVDHDNLPALSPSTAQCCDRDVDQSLPVGNLEYSSSQYSVELPHQPQSSVDLPNGMIDTGGQQSNFITKTHLEISHSGTTATASTLQMTSGLPRLGSDTVFTPPMTFGLPRLGSDTVFTPQMTSGLPRLGSDTVFTPQMTSGLPRLGSDTVFTPQMTSGLPRLGSDTVFTPPMTSGLPQLRLGSRAGCSNALVSGGIESSEYARFLLNNSQPMCCNAVGGYAEQNARIDLDLKNAEDGLDAVIGNISLGFDYNLNNEGSEFNNSCNYNAPIFPCEQSNLGIESDLMSIDGIPNTSAKKPRVRNSTKNGKNSKVCEYCGRAFRDSYCVKRHIYSVHVEDKIFACELCLERFKSKQGLLGHMKKEHSGNDFHPINEQPN